MRGSIFDPFHWLDVVQAWMIRRRSPDIYSFGPVNLSGGRAEVIGPEREVAE